MIETQIIDDNKQAIVIELCEEIKTLIYNPINVWAVAATIESLGIRDIDARQDYGFESVFTLADYVYKTIKEEFAEENRNLVQDSENDIVKPPWTERSKDFTKHYSFGIWFAMPMVVQIIAIIAFRCALWAWMDFNEGQATVVALGTIVSFIITGGFVQTMGRQITGYRGAGNHKAVYAAARAIVIWGCVATIMVALALYLLNWIIPFYPQVMMNISLTYMILISLLLLAAAVLYALETRVMITISIVFGTILVILGMEVFDIGIYFSHWIGLTVSTLLMTGYGYIYLKVKVKSMRTEFTLSKLPKFEVIFYNSYRYFLYGLLYFLFLFMDRILAWSAGPPPPTYVIWFDTPYELGMDWALISLILTIAVLEYSIHSFAKQLIPVLQKTIFNRIDLFNRYFHSHYWSQLVLLIVFGVCSILLTYIVVMSLGAALADDYPEIRDFFTNPITSKVFWLAAIGYLILCGGLMHTLFFFTLNRPTFVMNAMVWACLVNFLVGFCCSRIIAYEYSVLGLIAGALMFVILTGRSARRFFNQLDYFYYSAY